METKRKIDGVVVRLRCSNCEAVFPHFLFSGEEDGNTAGLYSVSSCEKNEIVIGEMESEEWNNFDNGGALSFEARLSKQLGRDDLRVTHLLRVEQKNGAATGINFRDFMKAYHRPVQVFSCICCASGESKSIEELTVEEFLLTGGRISTIGALDLNNRGRR